MVTHYATSARLRFSPCCRSCVANCGFGRATIEFTQQYAGLVRLRIMQLIPAGGDYKEVRVIDTPDKRDALDIAYQLVAQGQASGLEIDEEANQALQSSQEYVDSVGRASQMRRSVSVALAPEVAEGYEQMFFATGEQ